MADIVYLNGEYVNAADAKVSVFDRGFLFGDGVYEVIPVYHSSAFRLEAHLQRLNDSLNAIKLPLSFCDSTWHSLIEQVINKNSGGHLSIYIQVTRGNENKRNHIADKDTSPTVFISASPLDTNIAVLTPIQVTLLADIRWQQCFIKSTALLGNIILKQQAASLGYDEAILHRDKVITEGTTTNIFMVKDNVIYTPEKNHFILAGITRELIIELAESASIKVIQQSITVTDLLHADEVWLSSSSREISPVTQIDDKIIAKGSIGPMASKMHQLFQAFKQKLLDV